MRHLLITALLFTAGCSGEADANAEPEDKPAPVQRIEPVGEDFDPFDYRLQHVQKPPEVK